VDCSTGTNASEKLDASVFRAVLDYPEENNSYQEYNAENIQQQKLSKLNTVHYHLQTWHVVYVYFGSSGRFAVCVFDCIPYGRFEGPWTTLRSRLQTTIKPRYLYAKLHSVLSQKTEIFRSPSHLDSVFITRSDLHNTPHSPAEGLHREALRRTYLFCCTYLLTP
jgi:hypothetical protein